MSGHLGHFQIRDRGLIVAAGVEYQLPNQVEHIYSKIDASTRASASLFAMQQGLLPDEEFPARVAV